MVHIERIPWSFRFFFLFRTGLSQGSDIDSRLDEIDTFISTHYYQGDGQERPNMIFSVIGDSNNIVPKVWPKSRLQQSLTNAARAAGSMRIKINYHQFRRDRDFFLFIYIYFRLPNHVVLILFRKLDTFTWWTHKDFQDCSRDGWGICLFGNTFEFDDISRPFSINSFKTRWWRNSVFWFAWKIRRWQGVLKLHCINILKHLQCIFFMLIIRLLFQFGDLSSEFVRWLASCQFCVMHSFLNIFNVLF